MTSRDPCKGLESIHPPEKEEEHVPTQNQLPRVITAVAEFYLLSSVDRCPKAGNTIRHTRKRTELLPVLKVKDVHKEIHIQVHNMFCFDEPLASKKLYILLQTTKVLLTYLAQFFRRGRYSPLLYWHSLKVESLLFVCWALALKRFSRFFI